MLRDSIAGSGRDESNAALSGVTITVPSLRCSLTVIAGGVTVLGPPMTGE